MPTFTQPKTISDLLIIEVAPGWTKDVVILLSGHKYQFGQVLAKSNGKYQALDFAGEGDAAKPAGVLIADIDASEGDGKGVVIARGAAVEQTELVWPDGATEEQIAAALEQLNALGIVARISL